MLSESNNYLPFAKQMLEQGLGQAEQAHLRQREDQRSLRHHPDHAGAERPVASRNRSCTTWWRSASWRCFSRPAEFQVTTRYHRSRRRNSSRPKARCSSIRAGWRFTARKSPRTRTTRQPRAGAKDEKVKTEKVAANGLVTKPPARYTEATLLSAMEGAGKLVEDEELREAMAGKGLGTPATRAAIIEGLLDEKYLLREGRELMPTAKAFQLMTLLRGLGVEELTAPELTGEWEYKLSQMEKRQDQPR